LCRNFVNAKTAVTTEAAVNFLSIVMLLGSCMSVLIIMHNQFSVYEASRTSSPMIAREESHQVNYSDDSVTVWVTNEPIGFVSWLRTTVIDHSTSRLE
jgi:hypothetical protein